MAATATTLLGLRSARQLGLTGTGGAAATGAHRRRAAGPKAGGPDTSTESYPKPPDVPLKEPHPVTLTTPGCPPVSKALPAEAAAALRTGLDVPVQVVVVGDPPWTPDRIDPAGAEALGLRR
jgi:hypothetical protein